ncbi:cytochrome c oxidase assembly protein [Actinomadura vinacea]|uniref:Cytochrome c oxidase assembly protein n=1 Tax=Actinomadura vinacea TaxID=115336 RepID=A0ABN3K9E3_9ACTN
MRTPDAPAGARPVAPWPLAVGAALLVLALVVRYGGAFSAEAAPGLTQAGALTKVGLAVAELSAQVFGAVTVGWLLLVAVFLPARAPAAGVRRYLRSATVWAGAWALSVLAVVMFSVSDLYGVPVTTGVTGNMLFSFLLELSQGRALLVVLAAVVAVAVAAQAVSTPGGAGYVLVLALGGLLPPVFTGHAADTSSHAAAVYSLVAHVLGAALWVGGLIVLVAVARNPSSVSGVGGGGDVGGSGVRLAGVVGRYSRLALACFAVVAVSGLVNAWIRLGGLELGSRYGALVAAKTAALVGLGAFGWWHRRVSLPALRAGKEGGAVKGGAGSLSGRGVFVRIAAVEIVVMAATMALATGLSRTPPPEVAQGTLNLVTLKLGFPLPGPASLGAYLLDWRFDPLFSAVVPVAAGLYALGLLRMRRAGLSWPLSRTVAWYAGLAVMLLVTCGGLARYSMVLFSAHLVQHLVLSLVVPVFLLLGAPVTLALRSLPRGSRAGADAGGRPVREMLVAVLRSRAFGVASHPLVAPVVFVAGLYGFYLSPLFEASLRNHALHSFAMAVFVVSALVYLWPIVGVDPLPRRPSLSVRFLLAAVVVPFHALFGAAVMGRGGVLAADWYGRLGRAWGDSPLRDQRVGGGLGWALGEIAALAVIVALAHRWLRDDRRAVHAVDGAPVRAGAGQVTEE